MIGDRQQESAARIHVEQRGRLFWLYADVPSRCENRKPTFIIQAPTCLTRGLDEDAADRRARDWFIETYAWAADQIAWVGE